MIYTNFLNSFLKNIIILWEKNLQLPNKFRRCCTYYSLFRESEQTLISKALKSLETKKILLNIFLKLFDAKILTPIKSSRDIVWDL